MDKHTSGQGHHMSNLHLNLGSGLEINPSEAWQAIGYWTLARVGAHPSTRMRDFDNVQFDMLCGRKKRRAIVQLIGSDEFALEVGHTQRRTLQWKSVYFTGNVPVENLSQAVETAYMHVMG